MRPLLIAHRCGPSIYPEQSVASAQYALRCHADMVEMDVQFTSEGVPVICHDLNTERVFGVDCLVRDMSYETFMALRHVKDRSYASHSLDDVLSVGVAPLLLHQKLSGKPLQEVMRHLLAFDYGDKAVIGVQYPQDVDIVKSMSPSTRTLAFMPELSLLESFLPTQTDAIRLWENWVTPERIAQIHQSGHQMWIMAGLPTPEGVGYTTEEKMREWVQMGVDGILVNDVPWAVDILHGLENKA